MHVFLVHGTFPDTRDVAPSPWWRNDSPWVRQIESRLRDHGLRATFETFKWAGTNSEVARMAAAAALLRRFQECEEEGIDYCAIAHSHGGSVVWHALLKSMAEPRILLPRSEALGLRNRVDDTLRVRSHLAGLKGWITVGTPFVSGVPVVARVYGAYVAAWVLLSLCASVFANEAAFLVGSGPLPWIWWVFSGIVAGIVALVLGGPAVIAIRSARRLEKQREHIRTALIAALVYGRRWCGIWSRKDEAIASLRATGWLSVSAGDDPAPHGLASRVRSALLAAASRLDRLISVRRQAWKYVGRWAMGLDLSARTASVNPWPHAMLSEAPEMPAEALEAIVKIADQQLISNLPEIRELLARLGEGHITSLSEVSVTGALLHVNYFDVEWTKGAMEAVIRASTDDGVNLPPEQTRWKQTWEEFIGRVLSEDVVNGQFHRLTRECDARIKRALTFAAAVTVAVIAAGVAWIGFGGDKPTVGALAVTTIAFSVAVSGATAAAAARTRLHLHLLTGSATRR